MPAHNLSRNRSRNVASIAAVAACLAAPLLVAAPASGASAAAPSTVPSAAQQVDRDTLPRTVITTDGEVDDMNSFMRFLYYTNEIDVDGIVYTSSVHHWKGDGEHTLQEALDAGIITSFRGQTAGTPAHSADATTWRWNPDAWIEEKISLYGDILPNLQTHDPNFPSEDELLSKVAVGNINFENDFSTDTEGSDLIKDILLDDDPRDVWLQAWGGQSTIARALVSIEEEYADTPHWEAVRQKVIDKAVIATISNQDNAYADYIGAAWPEIRVYNWGFTFTTWVGGAQFNTSIPEETKAYYRAPYFTENVKFDHGPLLDTYHLIGDGQYLTGESDAPGWQPGRAGIDNDLAEWRMFDFVGPFQKFDMIGEGDTPAFLPLIDTGLRTLGDVGFVGWGGRFESTPDAPNRFGPQADLNPYTDTARSDYSLFRWVPDAANDFAARADWGVASAYADANHEPTASVAEGVDVNLVPGQEFTLHGSAVDPDGDDVATTWWQYREAGTYGGEVALAGADSGAVSFTVPEDAEPGDTIHLILEAKDAGTPTLKHWQRVVVTVVDSYTPTVSAVASAASTTGATAMTITGSELFGITAVRVGDEEVPAVPAADGRSLTFQAPASETDGAVSASLVGAEDVTFQVEYVAPTVTSITPPRGPSQGGQKVVLGGTDLALAEGVTFDGVEAAIVDAAPESVTVTSPKASNGAARVTVQLPGMDVVADKHYVFTAVKAKTSGKSVAAGHKLKVSATGLAAGEQAEVWLHSEPVRLGTFTADAEGRIDASVTIPAETATGAHEIVVRAATSGEDTVAIRVTSATGVGAGVGVGVGTGGGALAATGSEAAWSAGLGALALLALGTTALLAGRRRLRDGVQG